MKTRKHRTTNASGWILAVGLLKKYLIKPAKADALLSNLPENISSTDRRYCQFLFLGVIRHKILIERIIEQLLSKKPRIGLKALLMVAIYEIMEMEGEKLPKIIDFSVQTAKDLLSLGEAKLVNAVLRKVPETIQKITNEANSTNSMDSLAMTTKYSHPKWLVEKWIKEFGHDRTIELLKWDQSIPFIYARVENAEDEIHLEPTKWEGFYLIHPENWGKIEKLIETGKAYIQDPSTKIAPELADIKSSDCVLDLCAAPGGKSVALARKIKKGVGQLVSVDLPGRRILRLRENLAKIKETKYTIIESDVNDLSLNYFETLNLPTEYDVVLLDAPCSNTGVLRRRVDAKWRLKEVDIPTMAKIQLKLLEHAALFVKPGGKLIYSTCSIEREENTAVMEQFLENCNDQFKCIKSLVSYPWETGYDGGGSFLLIRKG